MSAYHFWPLARVKASKLPIDLPNFEEAESARRREGREGEICLLKWQDEGGCDWGSWPKTKATDGIFYILLSFNHNDFMVIIPTYFQERTVSKEVKEWRISDREKQVFEMTFKCKIQWVQFIEDL